MTQIFRLLVAPCLLLCASSAFAAYEVMGPVSASFCRGLVIKYCSSVNVAAVKGQDGRLYELTPRFEVVDEYNEASGRCKINFSSGSSAITSWLIETAKAPTLYSRAADGRYEEISSVTQITFRCRRQ